jgi:glucose-6-phosphate isomerase
MPTHFLPAWLALADHSRGIKHRHLRDIFVSDSNRFAHFSLSHKQILLDFSKQRLVQPTMTLLRQLAEQAGWRNWVTRMRAGEVINHTEGRAVRHTDLRAGDAAPPEVKACLQRMADFCEQIHNGKWRGFSGDRITDIVNIGIGGSDLGPRMAVHALSAYQLADLRVHFVSNLDSADLASTLARLNPRSTLFIIASKTFTTLETMANARTARSWIQAASNDEHSISRHFVATSSNLSATAEFGIAPENVFELWDWVGGRFSMWSAIGLPIALAVGYRNFELLLAGANDMDNHFFDTPAEANLPLTMALIALWNTNFLEAQSHGVFPYSHSLGLLPSHLQQLEMESNGKRANRDGLSVDYQTNPILWGEAGTNGQHSFFQLLHQGGTLVASDFIALGKSDYPLPGHHTGLLANCLAQSSALAFGQTVEEAREAGIPEHLLPFRRFPGNQPSNTLILPELTPFTLGQLVALYEHKVFCLGVLWNLNSFDQWGVELGKQLAGRLTPCIRDDAPSAALDASTRGLIDHLRQFKH